MLFTESRLWKFKEGFFTHDGTFSGSGECGVVRIGDKI